MRWLRKILTGRQQRRIEEFEKENARLRADLQVLIELPKSTRAIEIRITWHINKKLVEAMRRGDPFARPFRYNGFYLCSSKNLNNE